MWGTLPKVLTAFANYTTLLDPVVASAHQLDNAQITVVGSLSCDTCTQYTKKRSVRCSMPSIAATPTTPKGTGDVALTALDALPKTVFNDLCLVLLGDVPRVPVAALQALIDQHQPGALCILTAQLEQGGDLGRIIRTNEGHITAIREARDASAAERQITEINTGIVGPMRPNT